MTTILDLTSADVVLRRVASTNGGEYVGPCPACGGRDRFRVWPEIGRFWCRQCGASGGTIKYLMMFRGLSSEEAARTAGEDRAPHRRARRAAAPLMRTLPPSQIWQDRARMFAQGAQHALWSSAGQTARNYLHGRGLNNSTIKAAQLGYNASDHWLSPSIFGLPEETNPNTGKPFRLWLPRGLTVPAEIAGELWYLKIRRLPTDRLSCPHCRVQRRGPGRCGQCGADLPRYVMLRGSVPALYGADSLVGQRVGVFVAGELDALLLGQESENSAGVVTWGSETGLKDVGQLLPFIDMLVAVPQFLVAFDRDQGGQRGAAALMKISDRMCKSQPPTAPGKDITDWHLAGVDLRAWLAGELARIGADTGSPARSPVPNAMAAAMETVEQLSAYQRDVPIARQSVDVEEAYWREVWGRLGLPDPADSAGSLTI